MSVELPKTVSPEAHDSLRIETLSAIDVELGAVIVGKSNRVHNVTLHNHW